MTNLITFVHIGACFFLVLMILLQQSKGDGMGSAFGGGSTQSVLGTGATTVLTKITTFLAIVFMMTSLSLAYLSSKMSTDSILQENPPVEKMQEKDQETQTESNIFSLDEIGEQSSDKNSQDQAPSDSDAQ